MAKASKNPVVDDTTSREEIESEHPVASTDYLPDGDLVVPADVADHGGAGPAPLPHPLTEEANLPERAGEVSDPQDADEAVQAKDRQ